MPWEGVAVSVYDNWLAAPYENQADGSECSCGAYLNARGKCSDDACAESGATACKRCGRFGDWEEYAGHCPECGEDLMQEVRGCVPGTGGEL